MFRLREEFYKGSRLPKGALQGIYKGTVAL